MSGYIPGILANGTVSPSTTAATIRSNIAAVGGSLGSTDNRVLRADGTGGSTAQSSSVTIDDSGNVSGVGTFTASGTVSTAGQVFETAVNGQFRNTGHASCYFGVSGHLFRLDLVANGATGSLASLSDAGFRLQNTGALGSVYLSARTNVLEQRFGTAAQKLCVANTWTSATVNEFFEIDWQTTANECWLTTRKGSGGGSARDLVIGRDGVERLRATSGGVTVGGSLSLTTTVGGGGTVFSSGVFGVTPSTQTSLVHGGTGVCYFTTANGLTVLNGISASSSLNVAPSVWLTRASDGVWQMGTAGNNASGSLNLTNLTATGNVSTSASLQCTSGANRKVLATIISSKGYLYANALRLTDTSGDVGGGTIVEIATNGTTAAITGSLTVSALFGLGAYTVATLPSASANAGRIAQVTDSSVTANGSAVSGGGANRVMVFSNGSTWDVVVA